MNVLYVALGSAIGGVARYCVSLSLNGGGFPWGTLCVNVVGSLAIGALSGFLTHWTGNVAAVRAFAVVGVCGGFTTFSTFSNEAFKMLEAGQWAMMTAYVSASILAGLAAVWLGYAISK